MDLIKRELFVIDWRERGNSRKVIHELKCIQKNLGTRGESYGLAVEQETSCGPWPTLQKTGALSTGDRQTVIAQGSKTWLSQDSAASHEGNVMTRDQGTYGTVAQVPHTSSLGQTVTTNPIRSPSQKYHICIGLENADDTAPLLANIRDALPSRAAAGTNVIPPPLSTETTLAEGLDTYDRAESQGTTGDGAAKSISSGMAPSSGDQKGKKTSHTSPLGALARALFGSCLSGRD